MTSLNQLAIRLFRENKFLVFTSVASIAIAISLVVTMVLFAVNAKQTLEEELRSVYGDLDIAFVYSDQNPVRNEKELYQSITNHPSTQTVSKALVTQAYVEPLGGEVYTLGIENDVIAKSRYKTTVDLTEDTVIITENLADSLLLEQGDEIEIEGAFFKIAEILKNIEGTGIAPDMVIFRLETAKQFNEGIQSINNNETTALMVKTTEEADLLEMASEIKKIQPDLRVDIIEQDEAVQANLNSLTLFILILSGLILVVTSIMVISNFDLFIYKNKNQFAIMRTLGAKTAQLARVIQIQSTLITAAGAVSGLAISYLADQLLQPSLAVWLSVSLSAKPFAWEIAIPVMIVSSLVIQLFLYIPVQKSSKVLPLTILQNNEELDFNRGGIQKAVIKTIWISAIVSLLFGMILAVDENAKALFLLLSGFFVLAGLFLALPLWIANLVDLIVTVCRNFLSSHTLIALQNLMPQVKKNSFVILSISVVMIIAIFGSVLLNTIKSNTTDYINGQFPTSVVITSRIQQSDIDPAELSEEVMELLPDSQLATVSTLGSGELFRKDRTVAFDYSLGDLKALESMGIVPELAGRAYEEMVIISPAFADKHNLVPGDTMEIGIYSDEKQQVEYATTMKVSAVSEIVAGGEVLFDWQVDLLNRPYIAFSQVFVESANESEAVNSLETLKSMHPELTVNTHSVSLEESSAAFLQRWAIFILVLIVLVVSVLASVFNTLFNNMMGKRKEFAVLRAIGVRPMGITKIVVTQISFYLVTGMGFGVLCGVLFTFIIFLIDPGRLTIDFHLIMSLSAAIWIIGLLVFTPVGWKLGNSKIGMEMGRDNK